MKLWEKEDADGRPSLLQRAEQFEATGRDTEDASKELWHAERAAAGPFLRPAIFLFTRTAGAFCIPEMGED